MTDSLSGTAQQRLRALVARIERLNEDKAAIAGDLKEVFAEAKGEGFDTKILRKVVALRARDQAALDEEQALIELYLGALEGDLFHDVAAGKVTLEVVSRA